MTIISKYNKEQAIKFSTLLAITEMILIEKRCDFLGEVFMLLSIANSGTGQHFTPFDVSLMIAKITGSDLAKQIKENLFISISDPACGTGSLIIAQYQHIIESGFNPEHTLYVECVDIDPVVAMACYVQLSLLSIAGKVIIGNSLTLEFTRQFITPSYFYNNWPSKFKSKKLFTAIKNILGISSSDTPTDIVESADYISIQEPNYLDNSLKKENLKVLSKDEQMLLF